MTRSLNPNDRAAILAALQDPDPKNPLAIRVADALDAYGRPLDRISLPAPTDEIESVALELFMQQLREEMPRAKITIRGDS